ncbi:fasciclin domain-containing protein [Salinibacter altiplanensis]|uniref:fasciclin domain-containing protein n=1 Tax=Salinibacter altiplanensis TaxID=1803181 RepID=UPI00131A38DF|nr:fasciclin domain-containing protein [Salinibacter altiplanensis]
MIDVATSLRRWGRLGLGLLAFALVTMGCDAFVDQDLDDSTRQSPTIAGYVQEVPALSSLEGATAEAGLVETLDTDGPFTVFAPTNDAFSPAIDPSLNRQVVEKVVRHHVVDEINEEAALRTLAENDNALSPLSGKGLSFRIVDEDNQGADTLKVNRSIVTNPDASAQNGVVHVVDGFLADAVDRTTLTPRFTIFARLVKEAGLANALREAGANDGRTIFAPTNEALLGALDSDGSGEIEAGEIPSNAGDILQHHVLDSVFLAADVPESETSVPTLEGSDVTVVRSGDEVTVNPNDEGASVTTPNVEVDNGVIHGIDTVLLP